MSETLAVIGGGTMGNGIAQVFAAGGFETVLVDIDGAVLERARGAIEKSLGRFVDKGRMEAADRDAALGRLRTTTELSAVRGASLVVEAVPESFDLKRRVFAELDGVASPEAILATNTSSLPVTAIAAVTKRPGQVVGMHFMNPVPLMQLVEVIRGLATADESVERVLDLTRRLGKTPVEARDFPGFVSNRVLMPMINEAVFCLHEGVATREGIDEIMKLGMNHPIGPLALADLIGLDVCLDIMEVLRREFADSKYRACPLLRKKVEAGHLGRKSGRGFYEYS